MFAENSEVIFLWSSNTWSHYASNFATKFWYFKSPVPVSDFCCQCVSFFLTQWPYSFFTFLQEWLLFFFFSSSCSSLRLGWYLTPSTWTTLLSFYTKHKRPNKKYLQFWRPNPGKTGDRHVCILVGTKRGEIGAHLNTPVSGQVMSPITSPFLPLTTADLSLTVWSLI